MTFFDNQDAPPEYAVYYIYLLALVSVLLTVGAMHVIATRFWHRLYPSQN